MKYRKYAQAGTAPHAARDGPTGAEAEMQSAPTVSDLAQSPCAAAGVGRRQDNAGAVVAQRPPA
jgi:hypothetical protein